MSDAEFWIPIVLLGAGARVDAAAAYESDRVWGLSLRLGEASDHGRALYRTVCAHSGLNTLSPEPVTLLMTTTADAFRNWVRWNLARGPGQEPVLFTRHPSQPRTLVAQWVPGVLRGHVAARALDLAISDDRRQILHHQMVRHRNKMDSRRRRRCCCCCS